MDDLKAGVLSGAPEGLRGGAPPPCAMVIFGASGDLTARKLIPALYRLFKDGLLNKDFFVLGSPVPRWTMTGSGGL